MFEQYQTVKENCGIFSSYLPKIEDNSSKTTDEENHNYRGKHHSNGVVTLLSSARHGVPSGCSTDHVECETIEDGKENQGDDGHHDEVGSKQVVSAVSVAFSQFCGTNFWNQLIIIFNFRE